MSDPQAPLRMTRLGPDPAARSLEGRTLRPLHDLDPAVLGNFLDLCFVTWPSHHHWSPAVLSGLRRSVLHHDLSVGIELPGLGLLAACLASLRRARTSEHELDVAYIYVVGVHPVFRKRGLFGEVNAAVVERARAAGAEAVCVQTVAHHESATVYQRRGYLPVERYHAIGAPLTACPPAPLARAVACTPALASLPDTLSFAPGRWPAPELQLQAWEDDGGGAALAVWPVRVRGAGGWRVVPSGEVVQTWGAPTHAAAALRHAAHEAGCHGLFQAPGTGPAFPGLIADPTPEHALRLVLPLTERAERLSAQLTAWHPTFPAP